MNPLDIYLVQTDTTAGLLSQSSERLAEIKKREPGKPFIEVVADFQELQKRVRVPKNHRRRVRQLNKTTCIYPAKNKAIRVVKEGSHHEFLKRFGWMYSTSANLSGQKFDLEFSVGACDIVVVDDQGFRENPSSRIYRLGKKKLQVLR